MLTIESVGRKYVRFKSIRDDFFVVKNTTVIVNKDFDRVGAVYESESAYEEKRKLEEIANKFFRIPSSDWQELPPEKIRAIAEILEIEL
jgi:hypothetical protein